MTAVALADVLREGIESLGKSLGVARRWQEPFCCGAPEAAELGRAGKVPWKRGARVGKTGGEGKGSHR